MKWPKNKQTKTSSIFGNLLRIDAKIIAAKGQNTLNPKNMTYNSANFPSKLMINPYASENKRVESH